MELTSDDLKRLEKPLTGADWIRIFRTALETLKGSGADPQIPILATMPINALMQGVLDDFGIGDKYRKALEQELPTLTSNEAAQLCAMLTTIRQVNAEPPEANNDEGRPVPEAETEKPGGVEPEPFSDAVAQHNCR